MDTTKLYAPGFANRLLIGCIVFALVGIAVAGSRRERATEQAPAAIIILATRAPTIAPTSVPTATGVPTEAPTQTPVVVVVEQPVYVYVEVPAAAPTAAPPEPTALPPMLYGEKLDEYFARTGVQPRTVP